jgi:hypothetical protein
MTALIALMENENKRNLRRKPYDAEWISLCRLVRALCELERMQG